MSKTKDVYMVLRLDSKMIAKDIYGRDVEHMLPKGNYLCPVFDNHEDAVDMANGRFEIMTMQVIDTSGK
jgi:hypothetical protein